MPEGDRLRNHRKIFLKYTLFVMATSIVLVAILLRHYGPPWKGCLFFGTVVGCSLQNTIGVADQQWYDSGNGERHRAYREVYRGPFVIDVGYPRLWRGDYYTPEGELASTVRDGFGISTHFHPNRVPKSVSFYTNGLRNGPMASWYPTGTEKGSYLWESGRLHGPQREWYENGNLKVSLSFDHGIKKESTQWYESRTVKTREHRDETNASVTLEYYSTNGDHIKTEVYLSDGSVTTGP
jgi:hypothetical protein